MLLQQCSTGQAAQLKSHHALQDGRTPLHLAALSGSEQVLALLLGANANVNLTDKSGMTALHKAATLGHWRAVKLLLQRGADSHSLMEVRQPEDLLVSTLWLHSWESLLLSLGAIPQKWKSLAQHCEAACERCRPTAFKAVRWTLQAECCRLGVVLPSSRVVLCHHHPHAVSTSELPHKQAHLLPRLPKATLQGTPARLQLWPASCRASDLDRLLVTSAGRHQRTAPGSLEGQRGVHQAPHSVRRRCQGRPVPAGMHFVFSKAFRVAL